MNLSLPSARLQLAKLPESNSLEIVTPEGNVVVVCCGCSVRMPSSAGGGLLDGLSEAAVG